MKTSTVILEVSDLRQSYGTKEVLCGLSFEVKAGEIFAFLGPNGSGKTALFRILSTALRPRAGKIKMAGFELPAGENSVRSRIGVVFQSPSLDGKLTVRENLMHHGHLYGLSGAELQKRSGELLVRLGILDRANQRVEKLSGGLKRRAELAKAMLHRPSLLILDEPSTGLDPGARRDLWGALTDLRNQHGVTILLTTHLMDEADHADRIAILHHGRIAAQGKPDTLKSTIGGDVLVLQTRSPEHLALGIREKFQTESRLVEGGLLLELSDGPAWVARLAAAFPNEIEAVTCRKPTLEDVFLHETGHRFWQDSRVEAVPHA